MVEALDIWVKGIVQGVGFRPFVYRLAKRYLIHGWVLNAFDGVHIHAEAESQLLDEFVMELSENAPAAAQVTEIEMHEVPLEQFDNFEIRFSDDNTANASTFVSPDLALCGDCERELFDPADRRFRYPFINCTNCGPRFTITDELPYDRANTSMRVFPMCETCQSEYEDPADRRFHAQPDACFECGPHLTWRMSGQRIKMAGNSEHATKDGGSALGHAAHEVAHTREESDRMLGQAAALLTAGGILAVKGLGGYHLVCDANNPEAVTRLRERKGRDNKAFAVMMKSVEDVRRICFVSPEEEAVLSGMERPIVLLRKRPGGARLAKGVSDPLPELGVMLPYTPVQHLLMHDFAKAISRSSLTTLEEDLEGLHPAILNDSRRSEPKSHFVAHEKNSTVCKPASRTSSPTASQNGSESLQDGRNEPPIALVMTSGNVHDEPIVTSDEEAYVKLGGIADAFLGNDREILTRFDDSVLRVLDFGESGEAVQFIRRARGYAPAPISLGSRVVPAKGDGNDDGDAACEKAGKGSGNPATLFATGPEQKNTFAFLRGNEAFVSQHIGDVENAEVFDAWLAAKVRYEGLFGLAAEAFACDAHPEYLTTKWALEQAALTGKPLTRVQHHHAHIVAAMSENDTPGPVCGIAFDGTGYGTDGNIWGGEVLLSNLAAFERFANFAYVPMPGGAAAIRHPLRMAYGVLWEFDLLEHPGAARALTMLGEEQADVCERMIEQGLNTPVTSSVGRLFDAASALLGVCTEPTYEGEAAVLLEAAMGEAVRDEMSAIAMDLDENAGTNETEDGEGVAEEKCAEGGSGKDGTSAEDRYAVQVLKNTAGEGDTAETTSVVLLDAASTFQGLLDDMEAGVPVVVIARRFHDAMVGAVVMAAQMVDALYGIKDVVLTGGVFMNRYVTEQAVRRLASAGYTVILNRELPPNDGCISLGQAIVGATLGES